MKTWCAYLFAMCCMPAFLMAQNNKKSNEELFGNTESYILTDISFINDAVFMGRRDTIAAPYILPSIRYYNTSGFFVDASASYLVGSEENRVDLFLTSLGYTFSNAKLSGGVSGTAYFFNDESYNAKSSVLGDISGFLSYELKVLEVSVMASTYFNDRGSTDIFTGLTLDRVFYSNNKRFLINPTITLYAGSQYFYEQYYRTNRLGNRKGQGQGLGTGGSSSSISTTVDIKEASEFNILNVELSLPMQYYHKQFIFSFTPVLAMPQSRATITTENTLIKEDLERIFYFTAGIGYWFNTKKKSL